MRTRKGRTKAFRKFVEEKWARHFWEFAKTILRELRRLHPLPASVAEVTFMCNISANKNITMQTIEDNPNVLWSWAHISHNPNVTMEFVHRHEEKAWDFKLLSSNPGITMQDLLDTDRHPWDWEAACRNPNLTIEFIEEHPEIPWSWKEISLNPSMTSDVVCKNSSKPWDWKFLSTNPSFSPCLLLEFPDKNWDWRFVSCHPNVKIEFIQEHETFSWDRGWMMFTNQNVGEYLLQTLVGHVKASSITTDLIQQLTDVEADCYTTLRDTIINMRPLIPHHNTGRRSIMNNMITHLSVAVSLELISKMPDVQWNWRMLSTRPDLTPEFVKSNLDKTWFWRGIAFNSFTGTKEEFVRSAMRDYLAAYKIQQAWNKAITNPYTQIGINKVERDYKKLFNEDGSIKQNLLIDTWKTTEVRLVENI